MNVKKNILFAIGALVLAVLTVSTVFSQNRALTVPTLIGMLENASLPGLLATLLAMLGFIIFEGLAIQFLLNSLGYRTGFFRGLLYSAGDQFFSAITPSASGGQPVSALFMRFDRIPVSAITATLLANLVMYTLSTLAVGILSLLVSPDVLFSFNSISLLFIFFGSMVMIVLTILFYSLLKKSIYLRHMGMVLIKLLHKVHIIRDITKWRNKLDRHIEEFRLCSEMLSNKGSVLWAAFIMNLLQRASQISVTPLLHLSLGNIEKVNLFKLWAVQTFSLIGSNCVPIPGGMGVADYLMLDGFQTLFSIDYAYKLETLTRSISFYVCASLSGLIVLIGYIIKKHKH